MSLVTFTECQMLYYLLGEKMSGKNLSVGVIKEIDKLGRIVIPKEMRDRFALSEKVEVTITEEGILIRNPAYILVKISSNEREG